MGSSKFQPALLGGLLLGVLSALPFVSIGNVCCCLWVISGGAVAAYLLQQNQPTPITTGDGAEVGLLAGLIGAVVWQAIAIPINLALGPLQSRILERLLDNAGDLPENLRPLIQSMQHSTGLGALRLVAGFFFVLMICLAFSGAGGLIGAGLFRRQAPPSGPDGEGPVAP